MKCSLAFFVFYKNGTTTNFVANSNHFARSLGFKH